MSDYLGDEISVFQQGLDHISQDGQEKFATFYFSGYK